MKISDVHKRISVISAENIELIDAQLLNAEALELKYLLHLQPDRLLSGFYTNVKLEPKAERYGGWESKQIRGHTLGHYLTALSQAWASTGNAEILERISYIVDELKKCQMQNGYLSAFEEEYFDFVEQKKPVWVPWYTMNKIISGLNSVVNYTKNPTAAEVASRLGDWVYERTSRWSPELREIVLSVEYGGMNDCMYDLYKQSGKAHHLEAAHSFDEMKLFTALEQGRDILKGLHANTTIPKFLGAINRYSITGEEFYLNASESFWDIVVSHHSYITGGNSEWEHFGAPDVLNERRTNCNCETCNSYNMNKLSHRLYLATGGKRYMDFYENTFKNAIFGSQNPKTGMTTYFQPMANGYFKVYGEPTTSFWCCTGTGMENFTKLKENIYYEENNAIIINRYETSILRTERLKITQRSDLTVDGNVKIEIEPLSEGGELEIRLRIPDWATEAPSLQIDDIDTDIVINDGYIIMQNSWTEKCIIKVCFPIQIQVHRLPDDNNTVAFRYGPHTLCAAMGTDNMVAATTGVDVSIPFKSDNARDYLVIENDSIEDWLENINENLTKNSKGQFVLSGTDLDNDLVFLPYCHQHQQRYGIYFKLVKPNSVELERLQAKNSDKEKLEKNTVDIIPLCNDQYELEHDIKGEKTEALMLDGRRCRKIQRDGWVSYSVKLEQRKPNLLLLKFHSKFRKEKLSIYVEDELLTQETVKAYEPFDFYTASYVIPASQNEYVTLRFAADQGNDFNGLFDEIRILQA